MVFYSEKANVSKADILTAKRQLFFLPSLPFPFFIFFFFNCSCFSIHFSVLVHNTMTSRTNVSILDLKSADDVISYLS